jgi:hypothetical protein
MYFCAWIRYICRYRLKWGGWVHSMVELCWTHLTDPGPMLWSQFFGDFDQFSAKQSRNYLKRKLRSIFGIFWQYFESESPLLLTICCPKNIKNICNIDPESDLPFQSYLANDRRHNYTTPKSYLELINLYVKVPILRIYVQAEKLTYKY